MKQSKPTTKTPMKPKKTKMSKATGAKSADMTGKPMMSKAAMAKKGMSC